MRAFEFTVPGDSNELSPNRKFRQIAHRNRLVQEWKRKARLCARADDPPHFLGKVRITFTIRRGRVVDADNAAGSLALKAIVDALQPDIIPDDGPDYVEFAPVIQDTGKEYRLRPEVHVLVEELPA